MRTSTKSERGPRTPPDAMHKVIINIEKDELEKARKTYSNAERRYNHARDGYHHTLDTFLRDRKDGRITGTKTELDHMVFWEQHRRADEMDLARQRHEMAKNRAKWAGAIPADQITSDFSDRSDDGYDIRSNDGLVSADRREWVEKWCSDERQKEIVNESEWSPEAREEDNGGRPLVPILNLVDIIWDVAHGKDRQRIDKWCAHQEGLRASSDFIAASPDEPIGAAHDGLETIDEFCGFIGFAGLYR